MPLLPDGYTLLPMSAPEYDALLPVLQELNRARQLYPPMRSNYEAVTIVGEEFDEWKAAILHGTTEQVQKEGVQLAAMILRAMIDQVNVAAPKV